jgi:hypothetical protein
MTTSAIRSVKTGLYLPECDPDSRNGATIALGGDRFMAAFDHVTGASDAPEAEAPILRRCNSLRRCNLAFVVCPRLRCRRLSNLR